MPRTSTTGGMVATLRRHPGRVAAALVAASAISALAVAAGGGSSAAAGPAGPTATASTRSLATTVETTGVLERTDRRTITYAGDRAVAAAAGTLATAVPDQGTTTTTTTAAPAAEATAPRDAATTAPVVSTDGTAIAAPATAPAAAVPAATTTTVVTEPEPEGPVVLTSVAAVATEVGRNTVLYGADDEPVVALIGSVPAWRALESGVDRGADVRQLEDNLTELGYGAGLTIDDDFTPGTAAAVKRWETAIGRADPDGVVEAGDIVFLAEPGRVLGLEAAVGDPLEAGTPILVVGSRQQVVRATVPVADAATWPAGAEVSLAWSDGSVTTGSVDATGREVTDGSVVMTVALSDADTDRPSGAQATASATDAKSEAAVAVPVSAVVEGAGGKPAVRMAVAGAKVDRVVPVTTGIVAGGWVEIRSGLSAGDEVRLPG